ncbi:MAG: response regulator [Clostridium sp.]|nr:response regulator [Clostridium sp.]
MFKAIIVEDDLMVADINKHYLSKTPEINICRVFNNGLDALNYLKDSSVDLIILDVYMPTITGMELLEKIREYKYDTDVIMVTAANDSKNIDKALKLGILDYLIKPFKYDRFHSAVDKFLMKQKMINSNDNFTQSAIDKLITASKASSAVNDDDLYKGLQKGTLNLIRNYMNDNKSRYLTSEEISSAINLSKVTVRRYMNYLIETKEICSEVDYKTGGRPSIRYKSLTSL